MKRVVSAALLSAFLTGSALAADTVVNHDQAPVPAATPSFVWTGGFVGLNAGYAWGKSRYSNEYRISSTMIRMVGSADCMPATTINSTTGWC